MGKLQARKLPGKSRRGQNCTRNIKMGLERRVWTEFIRLRVGRSGGPSEYSNEHSGTMKVGNFLIS
jgi:hypothetical protein